MKRDCVMSKLQFRVASPHASHPLPPLQLFAYTQSANNSMAPKSSPFTPSSQKTKQQSISSFFAPKPSPAIKPAAKPATPASAPPDSDEDDLPVPPSALASHKRTIGDDEEHDASRSSPPKRVRYATSGGWKDDMNRDRDSESPRRPSLGQASPTDLNARKVEVRADRTSKYIFSSSPPATDENESTEEDAAAAQKRKQELHKKFVKKLGRPDAFAELRKRNKVVDETAKEGKDAEGREQDEEESPKQPPKGKKATASKRAGKLTPMEKQYLDIKRKHLDAILVVEVGYKFQFYGEDARIASKELGIFCIPGKFRYDEYVKPRYKCVSSSKSVRSFRKMAPWWLFAARQATD